MNSMQSQYWRDVDPDSTMTKMEHTYWITKQNVLKKIGKKEDECVVASDAELDAKLELFRSIQDSCCELQKVIDRYQDRLCNVAQEENAMGRFLKDAGSNESSKAGKLMVNVGKSLSYSGKQRLAARPSLLRLSQEVDTFRSRAVADTLATLSAMEKHRVEYRAALRWMKDVSRELDPEHHLDKYRKVQSHVRRSKARFDKLKLDCLQKIDLLAAARCNMFSHALVLYHKAMLDYCERAAHAYQTVANTCKGYQHYEFNFVKELKEPSWKLAEQLKSEDDANGGGQDDDDILLLFDTDYHDNPGPSAQKPAPSEDPAPPPTPSDEGLAQLLLDLNTLVDSKGGETLAETGGVSLAETGGVSLAETGGVSLTETLVETDEAKADAGWEEFFGAEGAPTTCMPSFLMEETSLWDAPLLSSEASKTAPSPESSTTNKKKPAGRQEVNQWLNLFADLDPLADPDAVTSTDLLDRNC